MTLKLRWVKKLSSDLSSSTREERDEKLHRDVAKKKWDLHRNAFYLGKAGIEWEEHLTGAFSVPELKYKVAGSKKPYKYIASEK